MNEAARQLGATLRAWRERLSPAELGLIEGGTRRTSGLRREEVAVLAGLSTDYVVRLEQGRSVPSTQVLAALARALRLSDEERDHLFRLAGYQPPAEGRVSTHIPPGVRRLLARLADTAICVFAADWTLITWTPLWAALFGDPSGRDPRDLNLMRVVFGRDDTDTSFGDWPARVLDHDLTAYRGALVADLRAAVGRYPADPELAALVAELQGASPSFAELWPRATVARHGSVRKRVSHPLGDLTVDCDTLTVPGADLLILAYTTPDGTPDADLLEFIRLARVRRPLSSGSGGAGWPR